MGRTDDRGRGRGDRDRDRGSSRRQEAAQRTRERAKDRAREHSGTSTLMVDGDLWQPRAKCTISILPYVVSINNHPDGIKAGEEWFRFPYYVHGNVGPNKASVICPTTFGERCPICEEVSRLSRDYDANKKIIGDLRKRDRELFNVLDHKTGQVQIWDMSYHNFGKSLDAWIEDGDEMWGGFWLGDEDGFDLQCMFVEETFSGRNFMKISRVDFVERDKAIHKDDLSAAVCLDEVPKRLSYKDIERMLFDVPEEDDDERAPRRGRQEEDEPPARGRGRRDDDSDSRSSRGRGRGDEEDEAPTSRGRGRGRDADEESPRRGRREDDDPGKEREKFPEDSEGMDDVPSDGGGEEEDAPAPAKSKSGEKPSRGKGRTSNECPSGHTFGDDCDRHKSCDTCPKDTWQACADAYEAGKK